MLNSVAQVAIKVIDLLCMSQPARQALFKGLTGLVQAAAVCPAVCHFEGVCMRGEQLLLVMKQYSSSLSNILSKQAGVLVSDLMTTNQHAGYYLVACK